MDFFRCQINQFHCHELLAGEVKLFRAADLVRPNDDASHPDIFQAAGLSLT